MSSPKNNPYILTDENFDHEGGRFDATLTDPTHTNIANGISQKNTSFFTVLRGESGRIVNSTIIQRIVIIIIIFNAITMGIGTFDFVMNDAGVSSIFQGMDKICLCLFTLEISMQFFYHGFQMFSDSWLAFDFLVIACSWMVDELQVIRAFRVVRAFRLIVRIDSLRNLIDALILCVPSISAVAVLLVLIMYVFAVMFTLLFKDLYANGYTDEDYFSRLDTTLFTLFQMMTMDSWSSITKQVMVVYPWAWFPFITYMLASSFLVLNLVIAVMCDAVADVQRDEIETQIKNANSELSEKHEATIRSLENQVQLLTDAVENLTRALPQQQQQQQQPQHFVPSS